MNRKMIINILGIISIVEAGLMMLPLLVSLIYREKSAYSFIITIGIATALGTISILISKTNNRVIFVKEGFITVALAWLLMSAIGALPFVISGEVSSYVDAFFETVSGFTTTGASVIANVEELSHGILFWRSFTHFVGGMGVLVFIMAIVPSLSDRSIHIMRAEVPGPIVGKLVPTIKQTAKILYLIYIGMTAIEVVLLLCGGMSLFDSLVHAFGTAGTGGFGIKGDSLGSYSPYLQWVITIFMFLFGVNFNLYYFILRKKIKSALSSVELWVYFGIFAVSTTLITINILPQFESVGSALRASAFQVSSIITTTGYSTVNFNLWPTLSKGILFILMFTGACAGSTAGGLKISRVMILFKMVKAELVHMLHPRSVSSVKLDGKKVENSTLHSASMYFVLFMIIYFFVFFALCFDPGQFDFETNFTAVAACINNIGPGLGEIVGPAGSFAPYSAVSKIVLSFAMLIGRLEIYPLLFLLSPTTWTKK